MTRKTVMNKELDKFFVKDSSKDLHTEFGMILAKELSNNKAKTNKGKEFFVFDADFIDVYEKKKRNAQIILQKDIGLIIAETGIGKNSFVVEAGGGSGALGCFLANIAKKVISYEIREDFAKVIEENIELLGLKNIAVKNKDVSEINEKDVDVIVLDLPNPEDYIEKCASCLKEGGFLVLYLPSVTQIVAAAEKVKGIENLAWLKTAELLEREWKIDGRIARPEFQMLGHSGFLSFVRKM
jgi:tRNA (adenine57-N1/adenine58-N1)-methyltransferase